MKVKVKKSKIKKKSKNIISKDIFYVEVPKTEMQLFYAISFTCILIGLVFVVLNKTLIMMLSFNLALASFIFGIMYISKKWEINEKKYTIYYSSALKDEIYKISDFTKVVVCKDEMKMYIGNNIIFKIKKFYINYKRFFNLIQNNDNILMQWESKINYK